jgi:DmsE family decaheme c-type cytochrome
MKLIIKMLSLGLLVGGLWTASGALAASADSMSKDAVCTKCHDENEAKPVLSIYQTKHGVKGDSRTPSCQSCHGDSNAHIKNAEGKATRPAPDVLFGDNSGVDSSYDRSTSVTQNKACLACHDKDSKRTHWTGSAHQTNDVACASCHEVHTAHDKVRDKKTQPEVCFACHQEQRADSEKISHHPIGEGKIVCSDCHNLHGSAGPKSLKKNTVTETCYTCHAEKRGPFLWEHQPVTEDCTNCHTPHGSNFTPLLKSTAPFLCDDCHNGPHNSNVPYGPGAAVGQPGAHFVNPLPTADIAGFGDRSAAGRACLNCHSMVHGSNSPSGAFLHR